jgi:hypothetical protein
VNNLDSLHKQLKKFSRGDGQDALTCLCRRLPVWARICSVEDGRGSNVITDETSRVPQQDLNRITLRKRLAFSAAIEKLFSARLHQNRSAFNMIALNGEWTNPETKWRLCKPI